MTSLNLRCHQAGFSLIEVLIALLLGTIGLLGLVRLESEIMLGSELVQQRARGLQLVESELEVWVTQIAAGQGRLEPFLSLSGYQLERQRSEQGTGLARITVSVTWQDRRGNAYSLALSTLVALPIEPSSDSEGKRVAAQTLHATP